MEYMAHMARISVFFLLLTTGMNAFLFPENKRAIREITFDELPSLTMANLAGQDHFNNLQLVKKMDVAGRSMIVIGSRTKLMLVDPAKMSLEEDVNSVLPDVIHSWPCKAESKDICFKKGQTENECDNYIKVVEPLNEAGDKLFVCGTNAHDPICKTFVAHWGVGGKLELTANETSVVPGKEKCPYGPNQSVASVYTGGSLYSSTHTSRSSVLARSGSNQDQPPLKTSRHDNNLLNKPTFVSMGDAGDRVFVFMNEKVESQFGDVRVMSKVAQVCKNDQGGEHVLVRQWTTFLKTRLNCSYHGYYFDQLQDITKPMKISTSSGVKQLIFATFTSLEIAAPATAVCSFEVEALKEAMTSQFKTDIAINEEGHTTPPAADKHPGLCHGERLPAAELQFIKSHPVLEQQVSGELISTDSDMRWTALAVDAEAGPRADYTVLFLGTSEGKIVRYLAPDSKVNYGTPVSVQDVYDEEKCGNKNDKTVEKIIVNKATKSLAIAFASCIVSVPLHTCHVHTTEDECMRAADPYCGWDGKLCILYSNTNEQVVQNLPQAANNPHYIEVKIETKSVDKIPDTNHELSDKELQSDDAEVASLRPNGCKENSPVAKAEERIAVAGFTGGVPEGCMETTIAIIAVVVVFIVTLILGICIGFFVGRRTANDQKQDNELENKTIDEKLAEQKYIKNFDRRNNKNEFLNNANPSTPLVSQNRTSVQDESICKDFSGTRQKNNDPRVRDSRLSSTGSGRTNPPRYSTIRPTSGESYTVESDTLQKKYADSETLRFQDNAKGDKMVEQRHSVALNNSTMSNKPMNTIERRKKADNETKEIMRDSSNLMQDTEESLNMLAKLTEDNQRTRLDSDDSGKGESPRNSLQTESEKKVPPPIPSPSTKPTRPQSLSIGPGVQAQRRTRLNSEPTRELNSPIYNPPNHKNKPQRTNSLMISRCPPHYATTSRQTSTPNGKAAPMVAYNPTHYNVPHMHGNANIYSTMPKHHNGMPQQKYAPPPYHQMPPHPHMNQQHNKNHIMAYEQYANPQNKFSSLPLRRSKGAGMAYSVPADRGSSGSDYANSSYTFHKPLARQSSQPQYSTLQLPRNNNHSSTLQERPSTLQRREKLPSIMRPTSNQTNPMFVPPPKIPLSHGAIDENSAV